MRVPGTEQHRRPTPGDLGEPLREGIQRSQGQLRVDHIMPGCMRRVGRNPTPFRHESDQIPHPPAPFRIDTDHHPRITSGEEPIAPQTLLPRRSHAPGKPSPKKMRPNDSTAQHGSDGDGRGAGAGAGWDEDRTVGVTVHFPEGSTAPLPVRRRGVCVQGPDRPPRQVSGAGARARIAHPRPAWGAWGQRRGNLACPTWGFRSHDPDTRPARPGAADAKARTIQPVRRLRTRPFRPMRGPAPGRGPGAAAPGRGPGAAAPGRGRRGAGPWGWDG